MLTLKSIRTGESEGSKETDLFISACGYEGRARTAAEQFHAGAKSRVAFGFASQQELEYATNKLWFQENSFEVVEVADGGFREKVDQFLAAVVKDSEKLRLEIDISCFNRFRLAHLVDAARSTAAESVTVVFRYSIAEFTPPAEDSAPTVTVEPVIPQFAGWTTRPDRPPAAIVGLGYEPNKAIGIVDHLEINNATWAFYPLGPIPEYYERVLKSNQSLLELIQVDGRCQPYDLAEPGRLFHEMNSLVDMLKTHFNPVLIPFGPKLFALVTLLVACAHDDVGVWRVSSGALEVPVNRKPSGHVISLATTFAQA